MRGLQRDGITTPLCDIISRMYRDGGFQSPDTGVQEHKEKWQYPVARVLPYSSVPLTNDLEGNTKRVLQFTPMVPNRSSGVSER